MEDGLNVPPRNRQRKQHHVGEIIKYGDVLGGKLVLADSSETPIFVQFLQDFVARRGL